MFLFLSFNTVLVFFHSLRIFLAEEGQSLPMKERVNNSCSSPGFPLLIGSSSHAGKEGKVSVTPSWEQREEAYQDVSKQLHVSATWTQLLLIPCLPHHNGWSSLKPQVQIHALSPELLGPVDKINNTHIDLVLTEQFSPVN